MQASVVNNKNFSEKNAKVKAGLCIFPFKYKFQKHHECYSTPKGRICATEVSKYGTLKKYGYCPKKSTKKKTLKAKKLNRKIRIKAVKHKRPIKRKRKMARLNEKFIKLLADLEDLMKRKGEPMRMRAYSRAQESLMLITTDITAVSQLKGVRGIGKTILKKFEEFVTTGKLGTLERAKGNPIYLFARIYGIGPKKAKELVEKNGIQSLEELHQRQDEFLNKNQRIGLKYFDDIEERIPRSEIQLYEKKFRKVFDKIKSANSKFEIVGSYRRGASSSGDIDVILSDDPENRKIFHAFVDALVAEGTIIEVLSKGKGKSFVMTRLAGKPARRVDFMFAPLKEFPFAILYFTGSKAFNVMMREHARTLGFSMNEHKLIHDKDKSEVKLVFPTEKSIFDFLNMEFKEPNERIDGRAVVLKAPSAAAEAVIEVKEQPKKQTLKKKGKISTRKLLKNFKADGMKVIENLDEQSLGKMVILANDLYYNKKPLLTDNEYDILKEFLEKQFPNNPALKQIGAPTKTKKKKSKLPYFLASMDKIKPDTKNLDKFKKKYTGPYVVSAKCDGLSGLYTTEGEVAKLYTRGNGKVGYDISQLIPFLKLPMIKGSAVRGELILSQAVFKTKYSKEYKNARGAVIGIINSDYSNKNFQKYKDISFVAYEVIKPRLKPSKQMEFLKKNKFITVKYTILQDMTNEKLSELLVDWRKNYKYENDGLVVVDNKIYPRRKKNPKQAFAFKMVLSDQKAEAKVLDVIWNPSKDGFLKPTVRIEPVIIGGTTIEYATAYNAAFVAKNKIGLGAVVDMIRSGDVIPTILSVITPARKAKMPDIPYHWNETHVDIILDNIEENIGVQEKLVSRFFKKLDVESLGAGNVKRIMKAGHNTIEKIINMKKEDFLKIEGFKEKLAEKVYTSIHQKLDEASLVDLMSASNIFGRGMGKRRLQPIIDAYPDIIKGTMSKEEAEEKIAGLKGFGKKTSKDFMAHLMVFLKFIKAIHLEKKLNIKKKATGDASHPLFGKKIVMTGFRDKVLAKKILKVTGKALSSSISKNTFAVIVKDVADTTGKAEAARALGIPLFTPAQFQKKYEL